MNVAYRSSLHDKDLVKGVAEEICWKRNIHLDTVPSSSNSSPASFSSIGLCTSQVTPQGGRVPDHRHRDPVQFPADISSCAPPRTTSFVCRALQDLRLSTTDALDLLVSRQSQTLVLGAAAVRSPAAVVSAEQANGASGVALVLQAGSHSVGMAMAVLEVFIVVAVAVGHNESGCRGGKSENSGAEIHVVDWWIGELVFPLQKW